MPVKLPQFVPILTSFTARVGGRGLDDLLMSSAALARAIAETQVLVGNDGVLCLYHPSLLVSACLVREDRTREGDHALPVQLRSAEDIVRGRGFGTVLDAIRPLKHQLPSNVLVFAALAGPALLLSELTVLCRPTDRGEPVDHDYVTSAVLSAVRSALESGADGIALIERGTAPLSSELLASHKTVRKVADFFGSAFLLFWEGCDDPAHAISPAHCVFHLPSRGNAVTPIVGSIVPSCTAAAAPVTTAGDIPADTAVKDLQALRSKIPEVHRIQG